MGRISSLARPPAGMQCRAGAVQQCPPSPVSAFENINVKHSIISAQYDAKAGKMVWRCSAGSRPGRSRGHRITLPELLHGHASRCLRARTAGRDSR